MLLLPYIEGMIETTHSNKHAKLPGSLQRITKEGPNALVCPSAAVTGEQQKAGEPLERRTAKDAGH